MAEISEKVARAICEAMGTSPDSIKIRRAPEWPGFKQAAGWKLGFVEVPAWRIAQRAAAEAEEQKP